MHISAIINYYFYILFTFQDTERISDLSSEDDFMKNAKVFDPAAEEAKNK